MSQALEFPRLDFNGVLVIGGLIAGAYILFKVSKSANQIVDSAKTAVNAVVDKAASTTQNALNTVNTSFTYSAEIKPGDSINNQPSSSFNSVKNGDAFDPLDPMYTDGRVYYFMGTPAIVQNRIESPFVLN